MVRFFIWYVAGVLLFYAITASWSLGRASQVVSADQQEIAYLSSQLSETRARFAARYQRDECMRAPDACVN
jgi:hypothetical protein